MRVELGAHVWTSDGEDIGAIDRLIMDPETHDVKAVAIRQGGILSADVEVPLTALEIDGEGRLRVPYTADQVEQLPPFYEANYTDVPPTGFIPPAAGYPGAGLYWPVGYGMAVPPYPTPGYGYDYAYGSTDNSPEARERERKLHQQDIENALIKEGSDVRTLDAEKVGEVHRLVFDTKTGHLERLIVREGFFFTNDFELPVSAIAKIDDGVIVLAADKTAVEAWSDLAPGTEVWTRDGVLLGVVDQRTADGLDVVRPDDGAHFRVPLIAVAGLDDSRLRLAVGANQASRWQAPPSPEADVGPTRTIL